MPDLWTPAVRAIVVVALLLATSALVLVALATARAAGIGQCDGWVSELPRVRGQNRAPAVCGPNCVIVSYRCNPVS